MESQDGEDTKINLRNKRPECRIADEPESARVDFKVIESSLDIYSWLHLCVNPIQPTTAVFVGCYVHYYRLGKLIQWERWATIIHRKLNGIININQSEVTSTGGQAFYDMMWK